LFVSVVLCRITPSLLPSHDVAYIFSLKQLFSFSSTTIAFFVVAYSQISPSRGQFKKVEITKSLQTQIVNQTFFQMISHSFKYFFFELHNKRFIKFVPDICLRNRKILVRRTKKTGQKWTQNQTKHESNIKDCIIFTINLNK
jgi:hypothetical protein